MKNQLQVLRNLRKYTFQLVETEERGRLIRKIRLKGQKVVGEKKFCVQNILCSKIFGSEKFWVKNNFGTKNF